MEQAVHVNDPNTAIDTIASLITAPSQRHRRVTQRRAPAIHQREGSAQHTWRDVAGEQQIGIAYKNERRWCAEALHEDGNIQLGPCGEDVLSLGGSGDALAEVSHVVARALALLTVDARGARTREALGKHALVFQQIQAQNACDQSAGRIEHV